MNSPTNSALQPVYLTTEPNQEIQLYEGDLEINQGNNILKGSGCVFLSWSSYPDVQFKFFGSSNCFFVISHDEAEAELRLLDFAISVSIAVLITKISPPENSDASVSGLSKQPTRFGSGDNLSYLLFHLTNFHRLSGAWISADCEDWAGRVILEAEGWKVTIDSLKDIENTISSLELQGGYAITHVVKLERSNQKSFSSTEAEDLLKALSFFLSFSRGRRTSTILPVGYDSRGEKVWEEWRSYIAKPWLKVDSWLPTESHGQSLSEAFPGFMHRWRSRIWNEPIRRVIHWYEEGNAKAGGVQGSIILVQAALELLAWVGLVEERVVSEQEFRDKKNENYNSISSKINRLFDHLGIPTDIPDSLEDLMNWRTKDNGPYSLAEIRNNVVHAATENRLKYRNTSFKTLMDAYELGQWYLELALLRLFQYEGTHLSRVARKPEYQDNVLPVPWVNSPK